MTRKTRKRKAAIAKLAFKAYRDVGFMVLLGDNNYVSIHRRHTFASGENEHFVTGSGYLDINEPYKSMSKVWKNAMGYKLCGW